jgi:hypothetical protein
MSESKFNFPSEFVELPSKGLIYPEDHPCRSGKIEIKYMTAREEDILTNKNYIEKGTVIDRLLKSLTLTKVDLETLTPEDKDAVMIAARILGYGKDYTFKYKDEEHTIDLSTLNPLPIDEDLISKNPYIPFTLPNTDNEITFKFLTAKEETDVEAEAKKMANFNRGGSITSRLKRQITSVNGDKDPNTIKDYVENYLLASDSKALRKFILDITPRIEMEFNNGEEDVDMPIAITFFYPELINRI